MRHELQVMTCTRDHPLVDRESDDGERSSLLEIKINKLPSITTKW
jgi:hypothetical protein